MNIDNFKFGITDQGDPSLNFSWVDNLKNVVGAVVISKGIGEQFEDALLENKDKVIYHATCTGLGGTILEENVPTVKEKFEHLTYLINCGFPAEQVVVRIDPLFPNKAVKALNGVLNMDYIAKLKNILEMTKTLGIKRVRYSHLRMYDYVYAKLKRISQEFSLENLTYSPFDEIPLYKICPDLEYESCRAFPMPGAIQLGCISNKDLEILGHKRKYKFSKRHPDISGCMCPNECKLELILNKNINKIDCNFNCKYCYWMKVRVDKSSKTKVFGSFKDEH